MAHHLAGIDHRPDLSRIRNHDILTLHRPDSRRHCVQFYEDASFVTENVAYLSAKTLRAGNSSMVIATPDHRTLIIETLAERGFDLDSFRKAGRFIPLDAAETLDSFMLGGAPDLNRFYSTVGSALCQALAKSSGQF